MRFLKFFGKVFIVAEISVNHNGNVNTAMRLMDEAKKAGADAVKFQLWHKSTFPDLEPYRLSKDELITLKAYAEKCSIRWFCTPFDHDSVNFLDVIGMDIWKIPSNPAIVKRIDLVEKIFSIANRETPQKEIFLSTGISSLSELRFFKNNFDIYGNVIWLHCVSEYPCKLENINLKRIKELQNYLGRVGLSDHTTTISIPVAAVAMGARVIEKHLTLDRNQEGPDHRASIEPDQFKLMCQYIREIEKAI